VGVKDKAMWEGTEGERGRGEVWRWGMKGRGDMVERRAEGCGWEGGMGELRSRWDL